jgi:hypothetical protein
MTTKEFWKKYTKENILEIFDITYDFFSKPLPQDFIENYDVGEVILETTGHNWTANNFDKVLKFIEILKVNQPDQYKEYFQYLDVYLIDYYCYCLDKPKVFESFSNFLADPLQSIDSYSMVFKKLLFYQYTELLDEAITRNFKTIRDCKKFMGTPEYSLAICKLYMILQKYYEKNEFDRDALTKDISLFEFDLNDNVWFLFEDGLFKPQIDGVKIRKSFYSNKSQLLFILEGYFLRYMLNKGFEFYLSGRIWDKMLGYWHDINKNANTAEKFFKLDQIQFKKFLSILSGDFYVDNTPEMIATLWGSTYIYDFLMANNMISKINYKKSISIIQNLKDKVKREFSEELWNFSFVNHWGKADSITQSEFEKEQMLFKNSFTPSSNQSEQAKDNIHVDHSEQLSIF